MAETDAAEPQPVERWIEKPELRWLDPRSLAANPGNIREDLGDLSEIRDSIAARGVRTALEAVPTGPGEYDVQLLAGHRRLAGNVLALDEVEDCCERAQVIPVLVDPEFVGKTDEQIAEMLVENSHRKALTAAEEAAAYHQLELAGWSTDKIAKRTGRKKDTVRALTSLHGRPKAVTEHVDSGQLSLQDAAALAEFDDDPKALERILNGGIDSPWGFRHRITEEQRKRRVKAEVAALREKLEADDSVLVIKKPKGWPYDCREQDVRRVKDADGKPLDPQEVRTKPGFAVFVERDYTGVREVVVCLNPTAHGYVGGGNGYATPEEEARREAAAQAREERRAALETAAEVRRQFICETYGSPAAAKKLRETVLRDLLGGPQMDLITGGELAAALAGGETDVENAGEVKLLRIMVSRWIAAREHQCHRVAVNGWGDRYRALAWLEWLVAAGYELSEAEAALHDAWSAAYAEQQRQAEHEEGAACGICGAGPDEPCEPECLNVMPVAGEAGDPENGEEPEVPDAEPEGEERTDIDVPEPSDLVEPAVS